MATTTKRTIYHRKRRLSRCSALLLLCYQSNAFLLSSRRGSVISTASITARHPSSFLVAASPSQSTTVPNTTSVCFTSDEHVFRVLKDLRIQPPWRYDPECSTKSFNFVLSQLAESGLSHAGSKAEAIFRYMLQESKNRTQLKPDSITLNTVLDAYSKSLNSKKRREFSNKKQTAQTAYNLFCEWQGLYEQGLVSEDVDKISYNTIISAFGKAGMPQEAQSIFDQLEERAARDNSFAPDAVSHSSLLHAYAVAGQVKRVEELFQQQQMRQQQQDGHGGPPLSTIHSYNGVLYAYSKSTHPTAAQEFLQWWINNVDENNNNSTAVVVRPDTRSYNIVLHALSQNNNADMVERCEQVFDSIPHPNQISYTTLISAYARRLPGKAALQAIDRVMKRAWHDGFIRVDAGFISNVLYSVALCNEDKGMMPAFAEALVRDMIVRGVPNDVRVYNALIYCWSRSSSNDHPNASRRALELLSELQVHEVLRPDVKTYTTVLTTLSRSKDPNSVQHAESIIQRMEESGPAPNVQAYTALIQNYARSKLPTKAIKAAEILKRMKKKESSNNSKSAIITQPNIVSYNAVLNACEHTDTSDEGITEETLKVACLTFDEIRSESNIQPNHVTYGTFLGVLANLMPPASSSSSRSQQELVELVFRRCCIDGQVSKFVRKKLLAAVPTEEKYRQLLEGHEPDRLPLEWTRHVRETPARYYQD